MTASAWARPRPIHVLLAVLVTAGLVLAIPIVVRDLVRMLDCTFFGRPTDCRPEDVGMVVVTATMSVFLVSCIAIPMRLLTGSDALFSRRGLTIAAFALGVLGMATFVWTWELIRQSVWPVGFPLGLAVTAGLAAREARRRPW